MKALPKVYIILISLIFLAQLSYAQTEIRHKTRQLKNVSQARSVALKNTVVPVVLGFAANYLLTNDTFETVGASLIVYGLVVGPSGGNFYAEDYARGGLGVAARIGASYLLADATREILGKNVANSLTVDDEKVSIGDPKILVGAGIFIGSMIYNVVSAKASVERYNRKLGYNIRLNPNVRRGQIVPMISATLSF